MPMKRDSRKLLDWFQYPLTWWILFALWLVGFMVITALPGRDLPEMPFSTFDKLVHFSAFFIGSALLFPAIYLTGRWRIVTSGFIALFLSMVLGVADEMMQLFIPGRSGGDWGDMLANSLGAVVGVFMLMSIYGYSLVGSRAKARVRASN